MNKHFEWGGKWFFQSLLTFARQLCLPEAHTFFSILSGIGSGSWQVSRLVSYEIRHFVWIQTHTQSRLLTQVSSRLSKSHLEKHAEY